MSRNSIYEQLVAITGDLLGPAAERFIDRQITSHLNINPEDLTPRDLGELTHWIRLSIGVLSDDQETIQSYTAAVERLRRGGGT